MTDQAKEQLDEAAEEEERFQDDPLAAAEAKAQQHLDDLKRLAADFDNYRKRVAREQEALSTRAAERLLKELLPIVDDLERALEAAEEHEEARLEDGVRLVHRQLAREYHPDRNPGDGSAEERFKEVQGAYDLLSDPEKRKQYDTFGSANGRGGFGGGNVNFQDFDLGDLGDLGDLFGGIFGGRGRPGGAQRAQARRGNDFEVIVNLSFEDSRTGVQPKIPVTLETACSECHGSGAKPGTAPTICPECKGRGVVSESQGFFALSQPCPRCRGNGTVIEDPCPRCHGSGREERTKRYTVKIPAGVKDGTRIRLKGKGEAGFNGGEAGDLFVVTRVEPSKLSERRGDDLVVHVPVTYSEAALGAEVQAASPEGPVALVVKPGTQ